MSAVDPLSSKAWRLALGIAAAYLLLGVLWILCSDALVLAMSSDPAWLLAAQRYKGLFYVGATALALALLVRAGYSALLRAAAEAQSHELQVQDLFLRHPLPMWVFDRDSLAFLRVNNAAVQQYGYSADEFLRMTLADLCPPEDVPRMQAQLAAVGGSGYRGVGVGVVRHRRKSGQFVEVRITGHSVPYAGREAVMVMAVDVTSEVQAQRALQLQQAQYRQLHHSLAEVLWLATPDNTQLLYVTPAFEALYGRPVSDFEQDPGLWLQTVHPDDRSLAARSHAELQSLGHSICEYRICRPDGTQRWLSDRKGAIVDDEGHVTMIGGIAEDITAARERDAERAMAQAELEQRVRERTAELERVNSELDAFTRTAAHDLRSPLNAVAGFSHLLRMRHAEGLGPDGVRMLTHIETSARHMSSLISDLLALSRVSSVELVPVELDLAALAREVVQELRLQDPARPVVFEAPEQLLAHGDKGLLRALLANLLGNAWKFTSKRDDARITLAAGTAAGATLVSVADNGAGFDPGQGERLFKPFQRFHAANEFSGTGVGLATCRRIVERHGGRIGVESAPGHGARFHFTLPHGPAVAAPSQTMELQA